MWMSRKPLTLYFYPRPPRGGRPSSGRAGTSMTDFYPRPPRGGRRAVRVHLPGLQDFYPRPPRGGRPAASPGAARTTENFYPRPPRGGRPFKASQYNHVTDISIHALREEGDEFLLFFGYELIHFYPRPPRGGRRRAESLNNNYFLFLSTPSARRATISVPALGTT